jgi:hypothetical protein
LNFDETSADRESAPRSNPPQNLVFGVWMLLIMILLLVGFVILATMALFGLNAVVEPFFAGSTTGP